MNDQVHQTGNINGETELVVAKQAFSPLPYSKDTALTPG